MELVLEALDPVAQLERLVAHPVFLGADMGVPLVTGERRAALDAGQMTGLGEEHADRPEGPSADAPRK